MKKRYWIPGFILISALTGALLGPKLLIKAATEKPRTVQNFVTQPVAAPDLRQQMAQAVQQSQTTQSLSMAPPLSTHQPQHTPVQPQTSAVQTETPQTPTANKKNTQLSEAHPESVRPTPTTETNSGVNPSFQFNMREQEIASMIYNGIYTGTAPEYRASIQGVSVQLQDGRGKITVALLPRYLPDHFLKSLPGVNRDTPTIYLGGEIGLTLNDNQVTPEIHSLALGSLRIPAPFIKAMVKYQVQQQVKQITQLESGQQAQLDALDIANGLLSIRGHIAQ